MSEPDHLPRFYSVAELSDTYSIRELAAALDIAAKKISADRVEADIMDRQESPFQPGTKINFCGRNGIVIATGDLGIHKVKLDGEDNEWYINGDKMNVMP
jgi:hypothetical protein